MAGAVFAVMKERKNILDFFCNIKTIIAAGIAIYWLVTELL